MSYLAVNFGQDMIAKTQSRKKFESLFLVFLYSDPLHIGAVGLAVSTQSRQGLPSPIDVLKLTWTVKVTTLVS